MNYEKYLIAAGVDDPALRKQALAYLAKCERDYSAARIAWHKANPENTQEVKESYNRLRMAELNYKRIMKLAK